MQEQTNEELIAIIADAISRNIETDSIEFKDCRGGLQDDIWKSITAFSNKPSGGGMIVFGVKEDLSTRDLEIVGLSNAQELMERMVSYFNDRIVNADRPTYRILMAKGLTVLVTILTATQEEKKPCFDSKRGMDRGAYIRDGNTNRAITDDELRHFIRNSSAYKHDLTPVTEIKIAEIDNHKIQRVLREMSIRTGRAQADNEISETILENIKIASRSKDGLFLTLAGALVFGQREYFDRSPFNRFAIRCVHYGGSTPASPILDNIDILGPLDYQIDSMRSFVLRNITRQAHIEGSQRVEQFAYPEDALRETLANAVIHRDYTITQTYTQVRIFNDRIEVINPGNLAPGVTVDNIKEMQFSRNAVVASLMRDLNYLEEYGRGIDLVFSSMNKWGLPRPIFRNTANIFTVTLLGERFKDLSERQLAIWQLVLNGTRTTARYITEQLGVSRPTAVSDLNKLVELGLVNQIGSGPNISYTVDSGM